MIAHNGNLTDRDWDSFYQVDRSESPELRVDPEDRGKGVSDGEVRGILFC